MCPQVRGSELLRQPSNKCAMGGGLGGKKSYEVRPALGSPSSGCQHVTNHSCAHTVVQEYGCGWIVQRFTWTGNAFRPCLLQRHHKTTGNLEEGSEDTTLSNFMVLQQPRASTLWTKRCSTNFKLDTSRLFNLFSDNALECDCVGGELADALS